jgi:hypothetical protein
MVSLKGPSHEIEAKCGVVIEGKPSNTVVFKLSIAS